MAQQTYTTIQQACIIACSQAPSPYNVLPPDFANQFPLAISYAEDRIYQNIPFLGSRKSNNTLTTVAGEREIDISAFTLPMLVVEGVALITPTATQPSAGTRVPFDKATLDVLDSIWPQQSVTMNPTAADWIGRYWAMKTDSIIAIVPTPDDAYVVALTGLVRPVSLSSVTSTTYLSQIYPDLMIAGCMIYLQGVIKRNFGAQADDPRQAVAWEGQFDKLMEAARMEELRRRGMLPDAPSRSPPAA